ncbi:hypothetical protein ACWCP6_08430 [Streptomyces sp. NPDC002004]
MRRLGTGRRYGRVTAAAGAALCAVAALSGQASAAARGSTAEAAAVRAPAVRGAAAQASSAKASPVRASAVRASAVRASDVGKPDPYAFEAGAKTVTGATSNTDAQRLDPGSAYKSSIKPGGKLYYRLELGAKDNAYVSVTAVPRLGTKVSYSDGISISVEDGNSNECSSQESTFGSSSSPSPLAAAAARTIEADSSTCQTAGTYYAVVERTTGASSPQDTWDLELNYASEPSLKKAGPTTPPQGWNSASPAPASGEPRRRRGGSSFGSAPGLEQGVWKDAIKPGETLFYRVPVDWGQQLSASAELGSSSGDGFVGTALEMSVYNPVRGFVDSAETSYSGGQTTAGLDPVPPVDYKNRYDSDDTNSQMRFAGWYYLAVHLNPQVGATYGSGAHGLTLRVKVTGTPKPGPSYDGSAQPAGVFSVSGTDKEAAESGRTVSDSAHADTMRAVGVSALGAGAALVLFLVGWTVIARRRAAAAGAGAATLPGPRSGTEAGAPAPAAPGRYGQHRRR